MPLRGNKTYQQVVCPFCSLLCDDLVVETSGQTLRIRENGCPRAARGFEAVSKTSQPHVHGQPASLESAIDHAARILKESRQPIVAGLGVDVGGCRAALALAERCGAAIDHMHGAAMDSNLRVLQGSGWMMTTLAEVKTRADVIVLVGTDTAEDFPRFFERCINVPASLSAGPGDKRTVIYIGDRLKQPGRRAPGAARPIKVNCNSRELTDVLGALRVILQGGSPQASKSMSRQRLSLLQRVAATLRAASYGVFVWAPGRLSPSHGELVVRDIVDIVVHLNEKTRFAGLSLGGSEGGVSFLNACTWQTGYPPPVCFVNGSVTYDPGLYRSSIMLDAGVADTLLWVSCFDPNQSPPSSDIPTILVGRAPKRNVLDAEVFIPAGVPGLDHHGTLLRTDGVVSLPLRALRPAEHLPAAEILDLIRKGI